MELLDWKFYSTFYPELRWINTPQKAYVHYMEHGKRQGLFPKMPNLPKNFNWIVYLTFNKDLIQSGIKTQQAAIFHYVHYGCRENRIYSIEEYIQKQKGEGVNYIDSEEEVTKREAELLCKITLLKLK